MSGYRIVFVLWLFTAKTNHYATSESNEGICTRDEQELKDEYYLYAPIETYTRRVYEDTHFVYLIKGSSAFVDKSLFIKRVLETKEKVIFITSPPKTGKSCNLNMLKAFLEIRTKKQNATVIPRRESSMYKFFTTGRLNTSTDSPLQPLCYYSLSVQAEDLVVTATYSPPPIISKYTDFVNEHLGRYPVIFLKFTSLFIEHGNLTKHLMETICEVYNKHHYLNEWMERFMESDWISEEEKQKARPRFDRFWFYYERCLYEKFNATDLINGIVLLSQFMYEQYGEQVFILVDWHVDTILWFEWEKDYYKCGEKIDHNIRTGIPLLRRFMKRTFFENPYLKKAILTGTLSVDKTVLFQDNPDLVHYNAMYNEFQEFYGFTENEVNLLFDFFSPPTEMNEIDEELAEKARAFFNGYTIRPNISVNIYNMYSIAFLLDRVKIHEFWNNHQETFDKISFYAEHGKLREILKDLFEGNETLISYEDFDFSTKNILVDKDANFTQREVNRVMSFLCEMGVLTNSRIDHGVGKREKGKPWDVYVRIPNQEVRRGIEAILYPERHPDRQCLL